MNSSGADDEVMNILDLNEYCKKELFDWLTLSDLKALRQTCKSMKETVDHRIQTVYPKGLGKLNVFDQNGSKDLRTFDSSPLCKHINFADFFPISTQVIENIKPILSNVEKVTISQEMDDIDFYEDFLQHCTNLKYLRISEINRSSLGIEWLQHQVPSLEHLSLFLYSINQLSTPELQNFFQLNPNIRRFFTTDEFIMRNENWMKESNIRLDQLDVELGHEFIGIGFTCRLLEILFERGLYQRINVYVFCPYDGNDLNAIASLSGLNKFYLDSYVRHGFVMTPMPQLKEFCMDFADQRIGNILDAMVESFENIERIHFRSAYFDTVLPFIRRSTKLKKIQIQNPCNDDHYYKQGIIDFPALNRERKKCADASKITIYVNEYVYLETKEAFMKTDFGLIEMKRAESIVWELHVRE